MRFRGMAPVTDDEGGEAEQGPSATSVDEGPVGVAPSVHRRPGYPLVGCAPAEPASVSAGAGETTLGPSVEQEQEEAEEVAFTGSWSGRPDQGVAKDRHFLIQTMGSTSETICR